MIINPQQDTLKVNSPDSTKIVHVKPKTTDSIATDSAETKQTVVRPALVTRTQTVITKTRKHEEAIISPRKEITTDTLRDIPVNGHDSIELFKLFSTISNPDSSIVHPTEKSFADFKPETSINYGEPVPLNKHKTLQKGWVLGIGIFSAIIFIIVRVYFQKYLSNIITSLINIQIAEKLIREKNVLVRRVFILLNLNFVVSTSLFIYLFAERINLKLFFDGQFSKYLYLFGIFVGILLVRYVFILFIGKVFDSLKLFREYLHNTYLINKNLGLYLIPLVISVFYLQKPFSDIIFYLALIAVCIAMIYKYLRAIQIIMKYNVFLFYSILYLCTLEIIPALVGLKFVLSLR